MTMTKTTMLVAAAALWVLAAPVGAMTALTEGQLDGVTAGRYVDPVTMTNNVMNYWKNNRKTWGSYKLDESKITVNSGSKGSCNSCRTVYIKNGNLHFMKDLVAYLQPRYGKEWKVRQK